MIVGQGLAGSVVAWTLLRAGQSVYVVDAEEAMTASKVAAGLMTPVTGKRKVVAPDYLWYRNQAAAFYREIERMTGQSFFDEQPMVLLDRNRSKPKPDLVETSGKQAGVKREPWSGSLVEGGVLYRGESMEPAGRLHVKRFLDITRKKLRQKNAYRQHHFQREEAALTDSAIVVEQLKLSARRLIVTTGAAVSELFPFVPNNPAKGEVLRIGLPGYQPKQIVHSGIWMVPIEDGTLLVGSTYDWKVSDPEPDPVARRQLVERIYELTGRQPEVLEHTAGIRPTMKDYQPVIGRHPEAQNVFVLNGLGSKGTLKAPAMAAMLLDLIDEGKQPQPKYDYARLVRQQTAGRPLTQQAQQIVGEVVQTGDTVIDATVGNGFDTSFLAETVGPTGRVYGFDVQQQALQSTARRMDANGQQNVTLLDHSHDQMKALVPTTDVAAVMFNLGYLPRSDHTVTTTAATTLPAIKQAIDLLRPGGVLSVLCYRGHDGGPEEYDSVRELLTTYEDTYEVQSVESQPPKPTAPILLILKKQPCRPDRTK
ncbi:MAG: hypothetical protein Fues2KO_27450 [Fuerstiella sp.]